MFAFFLGNTSQESTVEIGTYSTGVMREEMQIVYAPLWPGNQWLVRLLAIKVGQGQDRAFLVSTNSCLAILDTGASLIKIPEIFSKSL